jgi:hypothetical protein
MKKLNPERSHLTVQPLRKTGIVVRSFSDRIPTKQSETCIELKIESGPGGSLTIKIDFPQILDKKDRREAQNTIVISPDDEIVAKTCIGGII